MTYKKKYEIDYFLKFVSDEPQSAKEIADKIGCSVSTAKNVLFKLEEDGKVKKKLISGKYYIWWKV
jgi:predicted transcriptional regulator